MATPSPHVLIVGAGLGGLALAQSLRKLSIRYTIFERDTQNGARPQGWALSLHPWMMIDLLKHTIADELADLRSVSSTLKLGLPSEGAIFDAETGRETMRFQDKPEFEFVRAERAKLRALLLTKVDVQWGKRFTRFEEDGNSVVAHFEDGTSARGDVLVGADGISSSVRAQLLGPDVHLRFLPLGVVVGEVVAEKVRYERWLSTLAHSFYSAIAESQRKRVFVGLKSVADDLESATFYWMYMWHDAQAAQGDDFWVRTATKQELHAFAMSQIGGLDEKLMEPLRASAVEGIMTPSLILRELMPPTTMPSSRVTLIGDAIHAMLPFRGEGGNQAMKDGFNLAASLASSEPSHSGLLAAIKQYEAEMQQRTSKSVLASRQASGLSV